MEDRLIKYIDKAISEVKIYGEKYNSFDNPHIVDTLKILNLLREDILINGLAINNRILRGFKDVCTATSIHYEESNFNDPLFEVYNFLNENIPSFGALELLRNDFGKGNPI